MSKLFIHIGPPKTATTSFQYFFQNNDFDNIKFYGIYQPRSTHYEKNILIRRLIQDINLERSIYREFIVNKIKTDLKDKIVLISEEKLIDFSKNCSVTNKINMLLNYFNFVDKINIIFSIRDPFEVIPSFYQQIFTNLPSDLKRDYSSFIESKYCHIYLYKTIFNEFCKDKRVNMVLLDFNKLVNNKYYLNEIMDNKKLLPNKKLILKKKNDSTVKKNNRISKKITLRSSLSKKINSLPIPNNLRGRGYSKSFYKLIPKLTLNKGKVINVTSELSDYSSFSKEFNFISKYTI